MDFLATWNMRNPWDPIFDVGSWVGFWAAQNLGCDIRPTYSWGKAEA